MSRFEGWLAVTLLIISLCCFTGVAVYQDFRQLESRINTLENTAEELEEERDMLKGEIDALYEVGVSIVVSEGKLLWVKGELVEE